MDVLQRIAEQRIEEAQREGLFEDLPGHGRPLELEDLDRVPEDLRASYLLLKGSGILPEEMQLAKEALRLGDLLRACTDPEQSADLRERLESVRLRYRILRERGAS